MIESTTDRALFKTYREQLSEIYEHYDNCRNKNGGAPIDEASCDCYIKQIFKMGREAERKLL